MKPAPLQFDAATHTYTLEGIVVPSVTGILRAAGLIDFSHIPDAMVHAARARGTAVHAAIHYFNEHDLDLDAFAQEFPDCVGYLDAWRSFTEQRRFRPVLNERRIASRRHRIAGTADCFGLLDGVPVLLDFATGRPQDTAKDLQTAAYYTLALEWATSGDDPDLAAFLSKGGPLKRYGVALRRDGTFTVEPYTSASDFRDFLDLVSAHQIVSRRRVRADLVTADLL